MNLQAYFAEKIRVIEQALDEYLPQVTSQADLLQEAMRYSVFAGGKRLRPILTIAAAETVGGKVEDVLPVACGLELIHTYSLIHDDLPAMDDDDYRRGKLTNHKVYGEAVAILAGDGLLTLAFEIMTQALCTKRPELMLRVVHEIAVAAGWSGMVGGQIIDLQSAGKKIDLLRLQTMHNLKTGALLKAAVRAGALLAGADPVQLTNLTCFAEYFGLVFQIVDDILDIIGDEAKLGKKVGSDLKNAKATYPVLYGLEASQKMAQELYEKSLEALASFDHRADALRALAKFNLTREF